MLVLTPLVPKDAVLFIRYNYTMGLICHSSYLFFLYRALFLIALSAILTAPLPADYVKERTRGIAYVFVGLGAGLGAVFSAVVLLGLTSDLSFEQSFSVSAGIAIVLTFLLLLTVKDNYKKPEAQVCTW